MPDEKKAKKPASPKPTSPKALDGKRRRESMDSEAKAVKAVLKRGGSMQSLISLGSKRSQKSGGSDKGGSRLASSAQVGAGCIACILASWVGAVSVLLMIVALRYTGTVVDVARERYILAAAERVGSEAAQIFGAAYAARDALDYAVQRQYYFEPLDYDSLSLALEPVFAARQPLRAVDIAFDTRNVSMTLRRVIGEGVRKPLLVQSDAEDCFEKLGRFGCMDGPPVRGMQWYQIGAGLPGGQEADNTSRFMGPPRGYEWAPGPGFVPDVEGALVESATAVAWSPAHSLIFRSVFPGSSGQLSIIARAVVEVTGLASDDRLDDSENLGQIGAVFICDVAGTLLATLMPGQKAIVDSNGVGHFRMAWEIGGWASALSVESFQEARAEGFISFKAPGNIHVAILAVRGNDHFFVVVASERSAYADAPMELICNIAQGIVVSPYPAAMLVLALCFVLHQVNARRRKRRVQPEERLAHAEKTLAMLRSRTGSRSKTLGSR
ncbi:unnamed protein product [Effrenium voratum]|uniref:Uncharacterized protein n=1 Tax=Effrenium voratum TaxID=2562239 RepID=A0AA36MKE9_9DINO|nr:unnamed protein product [Effrenium voratum]